jgi:6-pyruvoyltetrahydropterin/6-carboxytetrahydropterin synthase
MNRFGVTQQVFFCYGHRLLEYEGKCAHLHGHNAVAELTFEAASLDGRGMVVDFNEIKSKLKAWIETTIDHKMVLRRDDPLALPLEKLGEPVFRIEGNPTAENLSRILFEKAESLGLPVTEVKVWETPTQYARYGRS